MQRDEQHLSDILDAARLALSYIEGKTRDDFLMDTQVQDAVIRRLEIIGEAARRISPEGREKYHSIPWRDIIGMRNLMIHEYDGIDMNIVWNTVSTHLPKLAQWLDDSLSASSR